MLSALIVAVVYCAVTLLVAWLLITLIGVIPVPAPISGVLPTVIWIVGLLICLFLLLSVVLGGLPPL